MVPTMDVTPGHCAFHFQGSGLFLTFSGMWTDSIYNINIALQELQAVVLMLHRVAFHLSVKVVSLHLDNSTAKLIYVIKVLQYFLFFPD